MFLDVNLMNIFSKFQYDRASKKAADRSFLGLIKTNSLCGFSSLKYVKKIKFFWHRAVCGIFQSFFPFFFWVFFRFSHSTVKEMSCGLCDKPANIYQIFSIMFTIHWQRPQGKMQRFSFILRCFSTNVFGNLLMKLIADAPGGNAVSGRDLWPAWSYVCGASSKPKSGPGWLW